MSPSPSADSSAATASMTVTSKSASNATSPTTPATPVDASSKPARPDLEVKPEETADSKIARAKATNDRFKRRGKRPAATAAVTAESDGNIAKKTKTDDTAQNKVDGKKEELDSEYLREVQGYMNRSLKDEGAGKRPLVR